MELKKDQHLMVYIPDTRGVRLSPYGKGNLKIGPDVFTYSKLPGMTGLYALGHTLEGRRPLTEERTVKPTAWKGTCPGASDECQAICYARRPVVEMGPVAEMWLGNTMRGAEVPPIPDECKRLRIHVSGDFDSVEYIENWIKRLAERQDVHAWAYTRSWRVPELLFMLEGLRTLPNVQIFASMDQSITEVPPGRFGRPVSEGSKPWRCAWIDGDPRAGVEYAVKPHLDDYDGHNRKTGDDDNSYLCPEQTKRKKNCVECGYCIDGQEHDVTFLNH